MQATFPISVYRDDITRVVVSVFDTVLGLAVEPVETPWTLSPDRLTSAVYFVGLWSGVVMCECSSSQACYFNHLALSTSQLKEVNDDVKDTLGELANMLAGNLKSVLPRGVGISVPSVTMGTDYHLWIRGGNMVERLGFTGPCGAFWITLVEIATP